ncbi:MAG TPA: hypothetical protein VHQ70_05970 [Syntrophomonadaceae bacterium]|nr:hypothetical protein [Syntrophomonadaceae bacterium]
MSRKIWLLILFTAFLVGLPSNAGAEQFQPKHIKVVHEGQKTNNVYLLGEDGIIAGTVKDEVVVINGNLTLTSTANVKDRVFIIGGKLIREPGAKIGKGIFHLNLGHDNLNSLLLGLGAFIAIELGKLFLTVLIIFASLAALFLVRNRINRARSALQRHFTKTGLLGLLAATGSGLIIMALMITIWGIPAAVILACAILIVLNIGVGALSLIVGAFLLKNYPWGQEPYIQVLIGSLFIAALLNFPVLGMLWGGLIFIFALGASALSILPERTNADVS